MGCISVTRMGKILQTSSPVSLSRTILLLILSLASAYYLLQRKENKLQVADLSRMTISPIVPESAYEHREAQLVTRQIEISQNQTFSEVMQLSGMDPATIHQIYDSAKDIYNLGRIQAGRMITIVSKGSNEFERMEYSIDPLQTLVVSNSDSLLKAELLRRTVETKVEELGGTIEGSLYASLAHLGEKDELVMNFADIFEWDVNFFTDLQEGDSFRIIYEKQYVDGEQIGYGEILAAQLTNKGKSYQAIGYRRNGKLEYFSPDGKAMKKAFLAAPLKFSRITSGFTRSRFHPILKTRRPHYGIDYAAPTGTPVRSIGNGKVISAGWAGGAGKMIKIQHDREISTTYCHLSRFAAGIRPGSSVSQGQVIGYVGSTGLATGPHLDFRFLRNGKYINFLSIKSPQAEPLSKGEVAQFQTVCANIMKQLALVPIQDSRKLAGVTITTSNFRIL